MSPPWLSGAAHPGGGTSDEAIAQAELHAARARVALQVEWLRSTLQHGPDWRALARRHPLVVALGALAAGLLVVQLFRRR